MAGLALLKSLPISAANGFGSSLTSRIASTPSQVRHGLFAPKALPQFWLPKWLTVFEKQRLLVNGIEESKSDLQLFMFELNGIPLNIGFDDRQINVNAGELSEKLSFGDTAEFDVHDHSIKVLSSNADFKTGAMHENELCFCLKGSIQLPTEKLIENDFAQIERATPTTIKPNSITLIIS